MSEEAATLLRVTEESLYKAIERVRVGRARFRTSATRCSSTSRPTDSRVVREFVGHGIGQRMHEEPQVPNYGEPGRGPRLAEGMVLAIEPMVNAGKPAVKVLGDGWTAVTRDGSLSAHFEHTVAVTADGPWMLTAREVPVPVRQVARTDGQRRDVVTERCRARCIASGRRRRALVTAHIADRMDRNFVRILVGDRVELGVGRRMWIPRGAEIVEKVVGGLAN